MRLHIGQYLRLLFGELVNDIGRGVVDHPCELLHLLLGGKLLICLLIVVFWVYLVLVTRCLQPCLLSAMQALTKLLPSTPAKAIVTLAKGGLILLLIATNLRYVLLRVWLKLRPIHVDLCMHVVHFLHYSINFVNCTLRVSLC